METNLLKNKPIEPIKLNLLNVSNLNVLRLKLNVRTIHDISPPACVGVPVGEDCDAAAVPQPALPLPGVVVGAADEGPEAVRLAPAV